MTRHTQIHETTRYEVIVRGVQSRAEAEAIVNAVEALPAGSAWIPGQLPELDPATVAALETIGQADADDNVGELKAGEAHR